MLNRTDARFPDDRRNLAPMTDGRPIVRIIAARALNGVIGRDNRLPWHLPADLQRFKALTMGGVLAMGRKTFDSLPGLLPRRRHIVLTRDPNWNAEGVEVAHSRDEALDAAGDGPLWVIGGAEIIALFLAIADRIELTEIVEDVPGDVVMPDPRDAGGWREIWREDHPAEGGRPAYRFVTLERVGLPAKAS